MSLLTCEVLVTGTFNICHKEHIELFEYASNFGKVTVGINNDTYVKAKYGKLAIPLMDRAYVIKSCRFVDDVVVFEESEPSSLIKKLSPKYLVKGPDYRDVIIPETSICNELGVEILYRPGEKLLSSTALLSGGSNPLHLDLTF